jgi:hypothetical protein
LGYWPVLLLKMPFEVVWAVFFRALLSHTEFVVLARALLRRVSYAKRTCGPLLFVIRHTPHQHACSRAGVLLRGGRSQLDRCSS